MVAERLDPATALAAAVTRAAIVEVVRRCEHEAIADRLAYLIELDAEVPDEVPMDIDSLRSVAAFVLSERELYDPGIGVGPDGMVGLSWRLPPNGMIYLRFKGRGPVRYGVVTPTANDGDRRPHASGAAPVAEVMELVRPYLNRALAQ